MKLRFFSIVLLFLGGAALWLPDALAQEKNELNLFSPVSQVRVGETFPVKLNWKKASKGEGVSLQSINIPGTEPFLLRASSQSVNVQVANGQTGAVFEMERVFEATKEGDFSLGPVEIPTTDEAGKSIVLQTGIIKIKVLPSLKEALLAGDKVSSEEIMQSDGRTILRVKENGRATGFGKMDWWLGMQVLLFGVFVGVIVYVFKHFNSTTPQLHNSAKKEKRVVELSVSDIPDLEDAGFWTKAELFWLHYLEQSLGIEFPEKMTRSELGKLAKLGSSQGQPFTHILHLWEQHKFSSQPVEKEAMVKAMKVLVAFKNELTS